MAIVRLRGLPILDQPLHQLERLNAKVVQSDAIAYSASSPADVFDIPANTFIEWIAVEVAEAVTAGNAFKLQLGVSGTATKYGEWNSSLQTAGFYAKSVGRELSSAETLIATLTDVGGSAAAGSFVIWIGYRPNSNEQKWVQAPR
jgi:hypothetical protein